VCRPEDGLIRFESSRSSYSAAPQIAWDSVEGDHRLKRRPDERFWLEAVGESSGLGLYRGRDIAVAGYVNPWGSFECGGPESRRDETRHCWQVQLRERGREEVVDAGGSFTPRVVRACGSRSTSPAAKSFRSLPQLSEHAGLFTNAWGSPPSFTLEGSTSHARNT